MNEEGGHNVEPFLRWAGGKRRLVSRLLGYLPEDARERTYWEPFMGAGSLFFALQPRSAFLSDANEHLMMCYEYVAKASDRVHQYLREHAAQSCETYYYRIREKYNGSRFSAAQAARFIYLNSTCFNGIFRVNTRGEFNVPYGRKEPPKLATRRELQTAAAALASADIAAGSFEEHVQNASTGDLVYLDPPYPPLNGTAYFTHYTADRFGRDDQMRVADVFRELDGRGCKVMMTNADTPMIRALYATFQISTLSVTRYVTCKTKKHRVSELVITNYET